jgi:hypothetical protein
MDAAHDDQMILESGFAAELAQQFEMAADAAVSGALSTHARSGPRRWLVVASVVATLIVVAVVITVVPSLRSGGDQSPVVAQSSSSPSPSPNQDRSVIRGMGPPLMIKDVTIITKMGLGAGAQPWLSGRLGEMQPSFAAYLSGGSWQQVPIPTSLKNLCVQIALSPSDVWATVAGGLAHWDGTAWQKTSVSWLDGDIAWMDAMAASATDDIWAVGHKAGRLYKTPGDGPGEHTQGQLPATMHWDGVAWADVAMPPAPGRSSTLSAVSSRGGVTWAVGSYENKVGEVKQAGGGLPLELVHRGPIALRWDGAKWVDMAPPDAGGGGTALLSVLVLGRDDVWVLGSTDNSDNPTKVRDPGIYLAHWNGQGWEPLPVGPGRQWGYLTSIGGTADDDLWLGGSSPGGVGYPETAHWDGQHWTVYGPDSFPIDTTASGTVRGTLGGSEPIVVAASATDVWFNPGFTRFWYSPSSEDQGHVNANASDPMLFHWDGQSWGKVHVGF